MTFLLALFLSSSPAQADVCMNPFGSDYPSTKSECWEIYERKSHKCVGACVADCEQFEHKCNSLPDQQTQPVGPDAVSVRSAVAGKLAAQARLNLEIIERLLSPNPRTRERITETLSSLREDQEG